MMNGTVVLKHTRTMAEKLAGTRLTWTMPAAFATRTSARLPGRHRAKEIDRALTFIAQVDRAMEGRKTDPAERRTFAWQSFCKALLSSNEFIYLN